MAEQVRICTQPIKMSTCTGNKGRYAEATLPASFWACGKAVPCPDHAQAGAKPVAGQRRG